MFGQSAVIARQRKVKHVFVNMLASPIVFCTIGGATVAWQPTVGQTGLWIGPSQVLYKENMTYVEVSWNTSTVAV
jgi:hypothetical protein